MSEGENHVFCSTTTPAIIARTEANGSKATRIAPEQKSTIHKGDESEIALYWAACHRAAEVDVYLSGTRLGKRLKYQVSYPFPDGAEIALTSPLDVMKWWNSSGLIVFRRPRACGVQRGPLNGSIWGQRSTPYA